ncbi:MAG: WD40 repeat domain-containing protein [Bacteroides sp.]|nr:WD40 repeat domain-containing protein [Bacteroides sp.]
MKLCHKTKITFLLLICSFGWVNGQVIVDKRMKYGQQVHPERVDNYQFSSYYSNNKNAYNLKGFKMSSPGGLIRTLKVNPAGYSFAIISGKEGKTKLTVDRINNQNKPLEAKELTAPTAICYTPDSRQLLVADGSQIKALDSKTLTEQRRFSVSAGNVTDMLISPNGYYLALIYPDRVDIYNLESGMLRHSFPGAGNNSVAFSESSNKIGLLSPGGSLTIYNTYDFQPSNGLTDLGSQTSGLFFHPDENYVGFAADGNRIQFINLFDPADRPSIYEQGASNPRFLRDGQQNLFLSNVAGNNILYRQVKGFSQNNLFLVNKRVDELMAEWTKMRPGETELEYRERVNAESMKAQRLLFFNQVATELALTAGLGEFGEVRLGRYNPETGILTIALATGDIFIQVPMEDMESFGDGNNLEVHNPVYTVTEENAFKLIYLDVFNPTNGKTYAYDITSGQSFDFLNLDDSFVSLDLILKGQREDVMLLDIKDRILKQAKEANRLSDYTNLLVNSRTEQAYDASGNKIQNRIIDFAYEVDPEGSATEDFAPGKYMVTESPAAASMLEIIKDAFDNVIGEYIVDGKKVVVKITGSADALPINGRLAYDGSLGDFADEPCKVNGVLTTLSVDKQKGITTNEQLGFMRAKGVEQRLTELLPHMSKMERTYEHNIEVAQEKGAQFRRIAVSFEFIDAL